MSAFEPTFYYLRDGVTDLWDVFEPDPNGPTIPGYYTQNGQLMRFAPLSAGSRAPNTEYTDENGSDIANTWARKGSVTYNRPMGDVGIYEQPYSTATSVDWHPAHVRSEYYLRMHRNGTYEIWQLTRNWQARVVSLRGDSSQKGYLYPEGRIVGAGQWAENPSETFGDNYTLDAVLETHTQGRWWIPKNGNHPGAWQYQEGYYYGPISGFTPNWHGLGNDMPMNQTREFGVWMDNTTSGSPSSYQDPSGALRLFVRGWIRVNIKRNGQVVDTFRFLFNIGNWFQDVNIDVPESGSGGGGGGGGGVGGGGCVVLDAEVFNSPNFHAGMAAVGDNFLLTDPFTGESRMGEVIYSEPKLQPCVEIQTRDGSILRCSTTAPIPSKGGELVLAPDLLGKLVPTASTEQLSGEAVVFDWDEVISVKDIGECWVQHISVDDNCFWARYGGTRYILHHNKQMENETQIQ